MSRIDSLQRMLAKQPDDAQLHYFLATELFHAKRWAECVEHLRRYLALKPDDEGAAFRMLALSLFETGDLTGAKQAFEQGIVQAGKHGHSSMVNEFQATIEELGL